MSPKRFGDVLRQYRERSIDTAKGGGKLTQARLGELLGEKLGLDSGYRGATISEWERGGNKIHADDREVLVALLQVLRQNGGLTCLAEANELLLAGNYRPLDDQEQQAVFPDSVSPLTEASASASQDVPMNSVTPSKPFEIVFRPGEVWQRWRAWLASGPPPDWPGQVLKGMGDFFRRWSSGDVLNALLWLLVYWLAWQLLFPLMRWPFADEQQVVLATLAHTLGTLILPLIIGWLAHTWTDEFWRTKAPVDTRITWLYTQQGALIGFQLGGMTLFGLALVGYHFGVGRVGTVVELLVLLLPITFSYMAARQVPYNLWQAYERVNLRDGAIFFVCALIGPLWAAFFFHFQSLLLSPGMGLAVLLAAALILAVMAHWHYRRTGSTVIRVHWWMAVYGVVLVAYQFKVAESIFSVVALAGLVITFTLLTAWGRMRLMLSGAFSLLGALLIIWLCLQIDIWLGRAAAFLTIALWWLKGRRFVELPWSVWAVALTVGLGDWLLNQGILTDVQTSVIYGLIMLITLIVEAYQRQRRPPDSKNT